MEFTLLKPIIDLIKPIGSDLTKAAIRRRGETNDLVVKALNEKLAKVIQDVDSVALAKRMKERQEYLSLRKQLNYENVIELAMELALETPKASQRSIEEDWFNQWFTAVGDVSDNLMQEMWAHAFAYQSNSEQRKVSLKSLDILRLMERDDVTGFARAVELFSFFGYIFGASHEIINSMMPRDSLNSLIDLGLITKEESMIRTVAIPGGYLLYLRTEGNMFVPDPINIFKLSPRALELAPTIPKYIREMKKTTSGFDTTDHLSIAHYINLIAKGLDDYYSILLCVYEPSNERPPKGGRKRTHIWDKNAKKWIRKEQLNFEYNQRIIEALEEGIDL
jgi:hypothetical protein